MSKKFAAPTGAPQSLAAVSEKAPTRNEKRKPSLGAWGAPRENENMCIYIYIHVYMYINVYVERNTDIYTNTYTLTNTYMRM